MTTTPTLYRGTPPVGTFPALPGTPRNHLNGQQRYRLADHLRDNWTTLKANRTTQDEYAAMAARDLGFPVTRANIVSAVKAIGKPSWFRNAFSSGARFRKNLTISILARAVADLYNHLDIPISSDLEKVLEYTSQSK